MRPNFRLSWLVRAQVRGKMGNLTLLGGLRGTKLELKEALEAPKDAPRWPRCATAGFGEAARMVIPCAAHVPPCCMGDDESGFARRVSCSNSSEIRK